MKNFFIIRSKNIDCVFVESLQSLLCKNYVYSDSDFEYLFIVGGDGSFIDFVKKYAFQNKKIIGIKSGKISFLSKFSNFSAREVKQIKDTAFMPLFLFELKVEGKLLYALNDVYISGDSFLESEVYVNDFLLQKFRGSGILLSTQLGSTSQNKSLGGPILFPNTNSFVVNLIGSQVNNKFGSIGNSLVFSNSETIKLLNIRNSRIYIDGKYLDTSSSCIEVRLIVANSKILLFNDISEYIEKLHLVFGK